MVLTGRATQLCAIVLLASASSGCGSLVAALQSAIKAQPGSVELVTVTTKLPQVLSCIERTDGVCAARVVGAPSHVMRDICNQLRAYTETTQAIGTQAICDPTAAKLEEIMNAAAGRPIDEKQPSLSRSGTRDFAKTLFDAANVRSWTQISAALRPRAEKLRTAALTRALSPDEAAERAALTSAVTLTALLEAYFSDYFDDGHFVSLTLDPSDLEGSAAAELQRKLGLSASSAKEVVQDVVGQVKIDNQPTGSDGMYHLITAKTDDGFITRAGNKYQFPTVSVTFTPGARQPVNVSKVDFSAVGADLMRVFVEAVGDYWTQVPAVKQASGVKAGLLRVYGVDPAKEQVKEDGFTKVNNWSASAESAAAGATGEYIRGIAWVSLNNEALAKVIETAVGVAVRKASEKVIWCIEACGSVAERHLFEAEPSTTSTTSVLLVE
jgi:hypothetical protein